MRKAINAAIFDEKRILLVRKKQSWILPGGKPEIGESDIECLCREVSEELSGTQLDNIRYYNYFEGNTPHRGDKLRSEVYFANIKGDLHQTSAEINKFGWFENPIQYNLSNITFKIINSLIRNEYLKRPND